MTAVESSGAMAAAAGLCADYSAPLTPFERAAGVKDPAVATSACDCITAACGCRYIGDTSVVDHTAECRAQTRRGEFIAGLRAAARYLTAHPEIPLGSYPSLDISHFPRGTDAEELAEVRRIADLLGVTATPSPDPNSGQIYATRSWGPVQYRAIHVPKADMADWDEAKRIKAEVRAARIADEPRCPDEECGEPLALIASGAVGHCGRTCAPADEPATATDIGNPPGCDNPTPASRDGFGGCRCLACGRCGHHGNNTYGHFFAWCDVTQTLREAHFCCPQPHGCELEAATEPAANGGEPS